MIPCPSCHRHHRLDDTACPFCGAAAPARGASWLRIGGNALLAAVTPVLLAACYGLPPKECDTGDTACSTIDADGDGFTEVDDCDDANADINPGIVEACDDKLDNDCDGQADTADTDCQ